MNSKDYRNIREAYLNVYEQEEVLDEVLDTPGRANEYARKNVRSMLGAFAKGVVNKDISQLKTIEKRKRGAELGKRKAERKAAEEQKEQVDLYDIILSHLLDEGYADTEEAAEAIMVNMSEEWRETIVVEGYKEIDREKHGRMYDRYKKLGTAAMKDARETGEASGDNRFKMSKMMGVIDKSAENLRNKR